MRHVGQIRAAVLACVGALLTVTVVTVGEGGDVDRLATVCVLGSAVAVLCAAVFLYVYWHVGSDPTVAWLVTAVGAFALQQLNWYMVLADGVTDGADSAWCFVFQALVCVALGTLLVHGRRLSVRYDPLALGMLVGLVIVLSRILVLQVPAPDASSVGSLLALAGLGVVGVWNAVRIVRAPVLTPVLRHRIAAAAAFLGVGQVAALPGLPAPVSVFSAVANVAGGALLLTVAASRARHAVVDETSALRILRSRLASAQEDLHSDQARRHEIRSTLAGIATATELLQRSGLSGPRREQLLEMACAELHRLNRLVGDRLTVDPSPTELDAALRPVVLRHRVEGLEVSWRPTGHVAMARADDVAEVVNVLLANVQRHALTGHAWVEVSLDGDRVRVCVADGGPGVPPDVRPTLFSWGARGRDSVGEGVGLATARVLAVQMGASLDLDTRASGTRFVLSLPAVSSAVAQGVGA